MEIGWGWDGDGMGWDGDGMGMGWGWDGTGWDALVRVCMGGDGAGEATSSGVGRD